MKTPFTLTTWQKKQAVLLYHFASLEFLKGLQQRANDLIAFIDSTLDLAAVQNRDSVLTSKRWGTRDTSENWNNNAWPFLKEYQLSIAKDIANRASEIYGVTGTYQCGRGMSEYSMQWTTPDEQDKFDSMFAAISLYAGNIDDTMDKHQQDSRWDDFNFAMAWQEFKDQFPQLPKFHVRIDVEGDTGKVPVRTGVYVSQDDPHGALQFAWIGGGRGKLLECATFNELGLAALQSVGRQDLWLNNNKMMAFSQANINNPLLINDSFNDYLNESQDPDLAPSLIARNAFTPRPCKWYYVELINGEFDAIDSNANPIETLPRQDRLRVEGGQLCSQTGYWFTPSQQNSRRLFKAGEKMPVIGSDYGSDYGSTIWQWDSDQG